MHIMVITANMRKAQWVFANWEEMGWSPTEVGSHMSDTSEDLWEDHRSVSLGSSSRPMFAALRGP
jgi:hypothetical protein